MSTLGNALFRDLVDAAPLIHEDTKGVLPAGRIGIAGQAGEPTVDTELMSILAYDPIGDDVPQWHPVSTGWHGMFQSSADQTVASTGVAYAITYNITDISSGIVRYGTLKIVKPSEYTISTARAAAGAAAPSTK